MPGGSLDDQNGISAVESVSILSQCLSALAYLHGHDPPIVHRDIKPANILVQSRGPDGIYVKLGDFGLSKDYDNLSTICGSWPYAAPEIYQKKQYADTGGEDRMSYTAAVDVWSLGVVVYELLCPLPKYRNEHQVSGTVWCNNVVEKFRGDLTKRPGRLQSFLLDAMVVLLPDKRWTAQECYGQVLVLVDEFEGHYEMPSSALYASQDEQATVRYRVTSGPQTALWRPVSPDDASTDAGRYVRSGAPPRSLPTFSSPSLGTSSGNDTQHSPHPRVVENMEVPPSHSSVRLVPWDQTGAGTVIRDPGQADQESSDAAVLLQMLSRDGCGDRQFGLV